MSGIHACRESTSSVKLFRNFKEAATLKLSGSAEGLTGGTLLGVRGLEAVTFYSWTSGEVSPASTRQQQQHDVWGAQVLCLGVELCGEVWWAASWQPACETLLACVGGS